MGTKYQLLANWTMNAAMLRVGQAGRRLTQYNVPSIQSLISSVGRVGGPLTRLSSNCDGSHQVQDIDNVGKRVVMYNLQYSRVMTSKEWY
jgi:hypothetical protein